MLRSTPRTFVSNAAAYVSAVWSVIGLTGPSVPALLTATSRRPNRGCATDAGQRPGDQNDGIVHFQLLRDMSNEV
jgi:hypothetical protein